MKINYYKYDLPSDIKITGSVAIDTETMGLNLLRDRLCVVQLADKEGNVYLVHFPLEDYSKSPNLLKILKDDNIKKIFHFARFDVSALHQAFGVLVQNIYCTKIASKLTRTYTNRHGLKAIVREFLHKNLDKEQQTSYWGCEELSAEQQKYAAYDVIYLHSLMEKLNTRLEKAKRQDIAKKCFDFLPTRSLLDNKGFIEEDIFIH